MTTNPDPRFTWATLVPLLATTLEHGTPHGKEVALINLRTMAEAADAWNAHAAGILAPPKADTAAPASGDTPTVWLVEAGGWLAGMSSVDLPAYRVAFRPHTGRAVEPRFIVQRSVRYDAPWIQVEAQHWPTETAALMVAKNLAKPDGGIVVVGMMKASDPDPRAVAG